MTAPLQRVFTMRLKPGALVEYRRLHTQVWPELQEEIRTSGIVRMQIFEQDPLLVVSSELSRPDAWDRLWGAEIHRRWGDLMAPLLEFDGDLIASGEMREIYRFE